MGRAEWTEREVRLWFACRARRDHRIEMSRRLALLGVVLLVTSCGSEGTRSLTELENGSEVAVDVGDVIEVTLEENPSTGYTWVLADPPDFVAVTSDEYSAPDTDQVGAPGTRVVTLEVVAGGAGVLRLEYVRPFDDLPVAEEIVEFILVVGDAVWPPVPTGSSPATSTATAP